MLLVLKNVSKWFSVDDTLAKILLPIGFSYYMFQAISYLVDVCSQKVKAEKNIVYFALYMCYFPKFISGPIERADKFLSGIKNLNVVNMFEDKRISISFSTILYGYFMKVVVADRLAFFSARLLGEPARFGALWLFVGMIMYAIQIYCDFAGYSAVAIGISNLFGIELTENFRAPYLSANIGDFWRRWHISLSGWLKDYIYIPLGGNRKGNARKYLNNVIVFVICGIWHGADASFVVWGAVHALYMVIHGMVSGAKRNRLSDKEHRFISKAAGIVVTFMMVSFAWIFFGAADLNTALCYIGRMLSMSSGPDSFISQMVEIGASRRDILIPLYCFIVFVLDLLIVKKEKKIGAAIQSLPGVVRYPVMYGMIMAVLILGIYGPGYSADSFMYMNF